MRGGHLMSDLAGYGDQALGEAGDIGKADDAGGSVEQATAGGLLRRAREAAGLHIAALAVSLKVPVKKLEALEADRFDLLPDAVFVRALASSVCRTLKIDVGPVLQLLPQTSSPKLTYQGVGINTPFRAPSDGPGPSMWSQVSRTAVMAGVLLLLAALVIILFPALKVGLGSGSSGVEPKMTNGSVPSETVAVVDPRSSEAPKFPELAREPAPAAEEQTSTVPQVQPASAASLPPAVTEKAAVAPAPASSMPLARPLSASSSPASVVSANPASAAIPSTGIVVFTAKSESWVEVTDSKGQVVLRRILAAGEVVGASGALPLSAVVGRANATQVQIRGKAFDLGAVAKDDVARFEVK